MDATSRSMIVVHLTVREGLSSVFQAQVLAPMSMLLERGRDVRLVVLTPLGQLLRRSSRRAWQLRLHESRQRSKLSIRRLPSPPARLRRLWPDSSVLAYFLKNINGHERYGQPILLHCRGIDAVLLALGLRRRGANVKVLFDCRGLTGAEYAYVRGYREIEDASSEVAIQARRIERGERAAAQKADGMICVSSAMRRYVVEEWGVDPEKVTVVPCATDASKADDSVGRRNEVRRRLGLVDRFVVVYSGSLEAWQAPLVWLGWFKVIAKMRSDAHLLVITTHPERMRFYRKQAGVPRSGLTVISVAQHQVYDHLAAADCGFLVREPSLVNRVASPVKFAEYLSVGLPVLISEEIGDYSVQVKSNRLGILLPKEQDAAAVEQFKVRFNTVFKEEPRHAIISRCVAFAREHLDWGCAVPLIEEAYAKALLSRDSHDRR